MPCARRHVPRKSGLRCRRRAVPPTRPRSGSGGLRAVRPWCGRDGSHGARSSPAQVELEARVAHRVEGQRNLLRAATRPYEAVIHEAALRMRFGGRKVARAQLEYLLDMGVRPHITLRVIPFESQDPIGAGLLMLYADGPVPQLDTVQIDAALGMSFLHAESHLKKYRTLSERVNAQALGETESRDLLHTIVRDT
jgi:hypothetical protein